MRDNEQTEIVPAVVERRPPMVADLTDGAMVASSVVRQVTLIQDVMAQVMKKDTHYGVIPGTKRPTLLKPGAEILGVTFRLAPTFDVERVDLPGGHREYIVHTSLAHIPTGQVFGSGLGSCSTMESKYRWRQAEKKCPSCGKESIIKGKVDYGGGWVCYTKKGGCNAKFTDGDPQITQQSTERTENPDLADCYNTVLKMARKRSHIDATLTAVAASDMFTQDMEDYPRPDNPAPAENPRPGAAATQSNSSPRPSSSDTAKPPSDADRKKQTDAVALAGSMGITAADLDAFCRANMVKQPLAEMVNGSLVALAGKITSGVVGTWVEGQP